MNKLLLCLIVFVIGCNGNSKDSYQEMRKFGEEMNHQPLPKSLDDIKTDLYNTEMIVGNKAWVFKNTDFINIEVISCRKDVSEWRVMVDLNCKKPNHNNIRMHGTAKISYTTNGKFSKIEARNAKIIETVE